MSTRFGLGILAAALASMTSAWSQNSGIGLQAKAVATGGRVKTWSGSVVSSVQSYAFEGTVLTQDFWVSRQRDSQLGLEIDLRNFRRSSQYVEVLALFLVKDVDTREVSLLSAEQAIFLLPNGEFTRFRMYSGVARSRNTKGFVRGTNPDPYGYYPFIWSSADIAEGTKLNGWIVLAMVGGHVRAARASNPTLEALARDEDALADLLQPLLPVQKFPGR